MNCTTNLFTSFLDWNCNRQANNQKRWFVYIMFTSPIYFKPSSLIMNGLESQTSVKPKNMFWIKSFTICTFTLSHTLLLLQIKPSVNSKYISPSVVSLLPINHFFIVIKFVLFSLREKHFNKDKNPVFLLSLKTLSQTVSNLSK